MAKSSKLVSVKRGRVLLVRRKRDGLWMFPGGRKRARESDKECLRREMKEELPKLKLGRLRLWKEVKAKNSHSGRKMSDAIFVTAEASGGLTIGDRKEIDKATWRKPRGIRLTPTSRYIRDKLFSKRGYSGYRCGSHITRPFARSLARQHPGLTLRRFVPVIKSA